MLHKDLSRRPQLEILRKSHAYPTPKDTQSQKHMDEGTTHSHAFTSWYKDTLWCHIFSTHVVSNSLHPPLSPPALTHTHCLLSLPPFYSSIQSSLCLPPPAPLKWLIKDPKLPQCRHFLVPLYGHLTHCHSIWFPTFFFLNFLPFGICDTTPP